MVVGFGLVVGGVDTEKPNYHSTTTLTTKNCLYIDWLYMIIYEIWPYIIIFNNIE